MTKAVFLIFLSSLACGAYGGNIDQQIASLRRKTRVPLRVPSYFPRPETKEELFITIISAEASHYEVVLGTGTDCQGGTACRYGTLIGTSRPLTQLQDLEGKQGVPVSLERGIKGYFYAATCGANCSDSFVAWNEGKYHYLVGIKAEKKEPLIKAANSAIRRVLDNSNP